MVEKAVDDMYFDCNDIMTRNIKEIFQEEINKNTNFQKVWKAAKRCAKRELKPEDIKGDEALTTDHKQAICVYTAGKSENIYEKFTEAVRTGRAIYGKTFKFHSLHFWLTSAVQILNNNKKCHDTYRRSTIEFKGTVNQTMRFGFFASSSYDPTLTRFGNKTCFKIRTCTGADLKKYPSLKDYEKEVLIPPYERFKITDIKKKSVDDLKQCEVVYFLESAGVLSNVNCQLANKDERFFLS